MSNTKHTPGPWELASISQSGHLGIRAGSGTSGRHIADLTDLFGDPMTTTVDHANARLIAAAPELIKALAGCADALREAGKDFARANKLAVRPNLYELHEQAARAAIAKATGTNI